VILKPVPINEIIVLPNDGPLNGLIDDTLKGANNKADV